MIEDERLSLREDLLVGATDDWLSLADFVGVARRAIPNDLPGVPGAEEALRAQVLGLVGEMLLDGSLVAGDVENEFGPWSLAAADCIARIARDSAAMPMKEIWPGAACWFEATPKGLASGAAMLECEGEPLIVWGSPWP